MLPVASSCFVLLLLAFSRSFFSLFLLHAPSSPHMFLLRLDFIISFCFLVWLRCKFVGAVFRCCYFDLWVNRRNCQSHESTERPTIKRPAGKAGAASKAKKAQTLRRNRRRWNCGGRVDGAEQLSQDPAGTGKPRGHRRSKTAGAA